MLEKNVNPRVVVAGLASCFGCQINITNAESHLLDVLGQVDMRYWQLTSSDPMPEDFDIAVIEGAVTTKDAEETVKRLRERASIVIAIGSCANTAGIPGIASVDYDGRAEDVYTCVPAIVSDGAMSPRAVSDVIDVDYEVACCPIDPLDFVSTLHHALMGSNSYPRTSTLCGQCKESGRGCLYAQGSLCLGLVTKSGCGAKCPSLGRACSGCAGLSADANLDAAREVAAGAGIDVDRFDRALEVFNLRSISNGGEVG